MSQTRVFPSPGPWERPGGFWNLPPSERKTDRDRLSERDNIPPKFYPERLKHLGICHEVPPLDES